MGFWRADQHGTLRLAAEITEAFVRFEAFVNFVDDTRRLSGALAPQVFSLTSAFGLARKHLLDLLDLDVPFAFLGKALIQFWQRRNSGDPRRPNRDFSSLMDHLRFYAARSQYWILDEEWVPIKQLRPYRDRRNWEDDRHLIAKGRAFGKRNFNDQRSKRISDICFHHEVEKQLRRSTWIARDDEIAVIHAL